MAENLLGEDSTFCPHHPRRNSIKPGGAGKRVTALIRPLFCQFSTGSFSPLFSPSRPCGRGPAHGPPPAPSGRSARSLAHRQAIAQAGAGHARSRLAASICRPGRRTRAPRRTPATAASRPARLARLGGGTGYQHRPPRLRGAGGRYAALRSPMLQRPPSRRGRQGRRLAPGWRGVEDEGDGTGGCKKGGRLLL